jgi:2-amino-4-hydroxy-6-hydroxymethyldihydropteridine diphosphokinase
MSTEHPEHKRAYVGLGTNLGDRMGNLVMAVRELKSCGQIDLECVSSIYETEPVEVKRGTDFLNAVCSLSTSLTPRALLSILERIERKMGRIRKKDREPRVIDLDLLLHGDTDVEEEDLVLPHPRLSERGFVLVPLCEIAPRELHPVLKKTMQDILLDLGEVDGVRFYSRFPQKELVEG